MQDPSVSSEHAVLRRFVAHTMAPDVRAALDDIDSATRYALQTTYFVLDADPGRDVEHFATSLLRRLLRQLEHTTEHSCVEYQDRVRGRVIWPVTLQSRLGRDGSSALHVCREVRKRFDTPENQLLEHVLERIEASAMAVPSVLRGGVSFCPQAGESSLRGTADRLARIQTALRQFRQHSALRDVTSLPGLDEHHLRCADASPMREYAVAAHLYRRYRGLVTSAGWREHLAASGRRVLPLPARITPEGDRWIRLSAAIVRS